MIILVSNVMMTVTMPVMVAMIIMIGIVAVPIHDDGDSDDWW